MYNWDLQRAVEDCSRAVSLDANNTYAFNNLGFAHMSLGQWERVWMSLTFFFHTEYENEASVIYWFSFKKIMDVNVMYLFWDFVIINHKCFQHKVFMDSLTPKK